MTKQELELDDVLRNVQAIIAVSRRKIKLRICLQKYSTSEVAVKTSHGLERGEGWRWRCIAKRRVLSPGSEGQDDGVEGLHSVPLEARALCAEGLCRLLVAEKPELMQFGWKDGRQCGMVRHLLRWKTFCWSLRTRCVSWEADCFGD